MNKVETFLNKLKIKYEIKTYSINCESAFDASREINFLYDQMYKSLLCVNNQKYVLLLIQSSKRISTNLEKDYALANKHDINKITGYKLGTVSPICLDSNIKILIDRSIENFDEVSIGCGEFGKELIISSRDLIRITKAEIIEIV